MDVQKYSGKFTGKAAGAVLLTLAAALALWLFIAAELRRAATAEISRSLITINSYKAAQIKAWREDRALEALRLSRHPILGGIVAEELSKPGSRRALLNAWLKNDSAQKRYASMAFLSPKGAVIAATPGYPAGTETQLRKLLAPASLKGTPQLTDLYLAADGRPRMTMISPLSSGGAPGGKTLCLLVMNIDPVTEFYPLVKAAPLLSAAAETVLARREGENVLFLTDLDYSRGSALKLTRPLSDTRLPAAKALKEGYSGFYEGTDYRDRKVFSAMNRIEGTDWAVITKVDRDATLAPVRTRERLALALLLLAAGLVYLVVYSILRRGRTDAAAALEESRQLLAETEKIGKVGGWEYKIDANELLCTEEVHQIHELDSAYKFDLGKDTGFYTPASRPLIERAMRRASESGEGFDLELEIITAKGNNRAVHVIGRPDLKNRRVYGFFQDITERKLAEEQLRDNEAKYRALIDASADGILTADLETRKFRFANRAICRMLGYTAEELTGLSVTDIHPKDALPAVIAEFETQTRGEKILATGLPCLRKDGSVFYADISTTPVTVDGRRCSLGIFRDITERRKAEEALRTSEAHLRAALESTADGILSVDNAGKVLQANRRFAALWKIPQSLLERGNDRALLDFVLEQLSEPAAFLAKVRELYDSDAESMDTLAFKDGRLFERFSLPMTMGGARIGRVWSFRDITGRMLAGKERLSHLRFLESMDRVNRAIQGASDLETMMANVLTEALAILDCDRAWLFYPCDPEAPSFRVPMEITRPGYPGAGILNTDIPMPPDMAMNLRETLASEEPVTYTLGTEKPINKVSAEQFGVKSQMITVLHPKLGKPWAFGLHQCSYPRVWSPEETRLMQEIGRRLTDALSSLLSYREVRESEQSLKEAQRLAGLGNWMMDLASNKFSWSNEVHRIFETDPDGFVPSYEAFLDAIHPEDRAYVDKAYTDSVKNRSRYDIMHRLRMKDGRIKYVRECCETFYARDGRPLASRGMILDLTGMKLAELKLEKLNRDLMASKHEMENVLYITSHDLRTPLVNIQGFTQNLERYLRELGEELSPARLGRPVNEAVSRLTGKEIPGALKFVLESSHKMDSLISSLLKVARLGRVEMKPRNLEMNELLKKIVDSTFYQLKEAGAAAKAGVLPPCKADPEAVSQIFANLLENAIKYRAGDRPLAVSITGEARGARVLYKVTDNGSGIAAKDLGRIWDIFYRGAGAGEGEGIGLTVVKYMAEKNGGSIKAESEEGRGTVFYLELPAAGE